MKKFNFLFIVLLAYILTAPYTTSAILADTNKTELTLLIEKEESSKTPITNKKQILPKTGEDKYFGTLMFGSLICTISLGLLLRKTIKNSKSI